MNVSLFQPVMRSAIGFDSMLRALEEMATEAREVTYPPYNIEKHGENEYRIAMAVAGFRKEELEIMVRENELVIKGKPSETHSEKTFVYRGIAERAFERRFRLADHVSVSKADLADGLLTLDLVREVPEAMKPRLIQIG